jgi:N-acetylglucosamine-6-phosphate deacetylase
VRLPDGTLAGSSLTMDRAVGNLIRLGRVDVSQASLAASSVPARVLGLVELGSLTAGSEADLVLMDRQYNVIAVVVAGRVVAGEL